MHLLCKALCQKLSILHSEYDKVTYKRYFSSLLNLIGQSICRRFAVSAVLVKLNLQSFCPFVLIASCYNYQHSCHSASSSLLQSFNMGIHMLQHKKIQKGRFLLIQTPRSLVNPEHLMHYQSTSAAQLRNSHSSTY